MDGTEQEHGLWKSWDEFPAGPDKTEIEALWNQIASDERRGTHWAIQIYGTNPISGYRVRRPLAPAPDSPPTES
jgi:hypothetical protein